MKQSMSLIVGVAIFVILVGGALLVLRRVSPFGGESAGFDKNTYYAIFITNGHTYFGKVIRADADYLTLNHIYYLMLKNPLQQQTTAEGAPPQPQPTPSYTLVRLDNQFHGPQDELTINRRQILFIEPLKKESKVVTAIQEYEDSQPK